MAAHRHRPRLHNEASPSSTTSPLPILNALKLILIIFSCLCFFFTIFYLYPSLPLALREARSAFRWLWTRADFKSKLTPPVLFLVLNLVVGALALASSLVNRNKPHKVKVEEEGDVAHDDGEIDDKEVMHSSKVPSMLPRSGGLPPEHTSKLQQQSISSSHVAEGKLSIRKLSRSKSDKLAMLGKNNTGPSQHQRQETSYHQFADKRKMNYASPQKDALKKAASSAPTSTHGGQQHEVGDIGDEVDRKAEDFIGKFYQRMKMQRLESMKRYNERMDRSYGR